MTLQHGKRIWQAIGLSVATGMILCMAGCGTMTQSARALPPGVQGDVVGGGLRIEWVAPAKGTVYLVETTTNRVMETRSLDQGQAYNFAAPIEGPKTDFEKALGTKLSDARFSLYFQPDNPTKPKSPAR